MADVERKPWEQMEGEPKKAYACFLLYRDLGPTRSLDKAYASYCQGNAPKSDEKLQANGTWATWSRQHNWHNRALDWDIDNVGRVGGAVATAFLDGLRVAALKALSKLQSDSVEPKDWEGALDAILRIGNFIPAETIAALRDNAGANRPSAIGANGHEPPQDYRGLLTLVAPRPDGDSVSPGQDQSSSDGAQVGQVNNERGHHDA